MHPFTNFRDQIDISWTHGNSMPCTIQSRLENRTATLKWPLYDHSDLLDAQKSIYHSTGKGKPTQSVASLNTAHLTSFSTDSKNASCILDKWEKDLNAHTKNWYFV